MPRRSIVSRKAAIQARKHGRRAWIKWEVGGGYDPDLGMVVPGVLYVQPVFLVPEQIVQYFYSGTLIITATQYVYISTQGVPRAPLNGDYLRVGDDYSTATDLSVQEVRPVFRNSIKVFWQLRVSGTLP